MEKYLPPVCWFGPAEPMFRILTSSTDDYPIEYVDPFNA